MNTPTKAAVAILLSGVGAGGAIAANHEVQCSRLESDYLSSASSLGHGAEARRVDGGRLEQVKAALASIYNQCGQTAGETASQKSLALAR